MHNSPPDDRDDGDAYCPKCGSHDTEWQACWVCHGEGGFDANDEDPINFAPGESWETCDECGGHSGYLFCHGCAAKARAASADAKGKT